MHYIKIKLSLSDDEDFGDQMKIAHKIDDFVSIHRDDILFTNLEGSVFCSDMQMSPNLIEWKRNFSENYLVKYLDMASRYYEDFYFEDNYFRGMAAKVQHNLKRPYHYHLKNAFHILANYFYNFIKENDIKLFIQHITPHEPNIWLLHCICKDLGVKTMFLHGVIINKKSYYCPMEDVSDIGVYKTAAVVNENKLDLEIENNHKIDLLDREMDLRNNSLMVKKKIKGVPFIQKDRYLFLKRRIKSYLKRELNPMQRLFYLVS